MNKTLIKEFIIKEAKKELKKQLMNTIFSSNNKKKIKDLIFSKISSSYKSSTYRSNISLNYRYLIGWIREINKDMSKYIKQFEQNDILILENGDYKILYENNLILIKSYTDDSTLNINIDIIGKTSKFIIEDMLAHIEYKIKDVRNGEKDPDSIYIDYKRVPLDNHYISILGRKIETIYSEQIDDIIKIINDWGSGSEIYHKHGLPFKTGIILHGVPGTGKTSIVKALATYFCIDLITINISSISSKDLISFSRDIRSERNKIVLLEEIDLNKSQDKDKKTQELLTLLDGVDGVDNIIFIATTNYINKVDERIKRCGRFDYIIEITNINVDLATKMCLSFGVDSKTVLSNYDIKYPDSNNKYNPAILQSEILEEYHKHKSDKNSIININKSQKQNNSQREVVDIRHRNDSVFKNYNNDLYVGEINRSNLGRGLTNDVCISVDSCTNMNIHKGINKWNQ